MAAEPVGPDVVHRAQFGWDRRFLAGLDLIEPGLVPPVLATRSG